MDKHNLRLYVNSGAKIEWLESYYDSLNTHILNVREAGELLGVPQYQLAAHDFSKFSLHEFPFYARQFFGDKGDPEGYARAWLHHQNTNEHHWEYWITRSDHSNGASGAVGGCLEMPQEFAREMVADWHGAAKTYNDSWSIRAWWLKNQDRIALHPVTRAYIVNLMEAHNYGDDWS